MRAIAGKPSYRTFGLQTLMRWLSVAAFISGSGMLYMVLFREDEPLFIGATYSLCCCMPLMMFETGNLFPKLQRWIRRLSTPAFFATSIFVYFIFVHIGFGIAGAVLKLTGMLNSHWMDVTMMPRNIMYYAMATAFLSSFVMRVRQLLGREVFLSLLTARYRRPLREDRLFVFIDLAESTSYAEEFGDLRAQEFLSALFAGFAEHVRRYEGEIDDYIGDCAIVTWPIQRGIEDARCIRCIYDIIAAIENDADTWRRKFGKVPRLRVAMHGGPVITAEIGVYHHKITYFGDVVNTTARMEGLCKTLDRPVLISSELLARMSLPAEFLAEPLGEYMVKGRDQPLGVAALRQRHGQVEPAQLDLLAVAS